MFECKYEYLSKMVQMLSQCYIFLGLKCYKFFKIMKKSIYKYTSELSMDAPVKLCVSIYNYDMGKFLLIRFIKSIWQCKNIYTI